MICILCDQPVWRDALAALLREFSYECPTAPVPPGEWGGADLLLTAQSRPCETLAADLEQARDLSPGLRLVCLCETAADLASWLPLQPDGIVLQQDGTPVLVDAIASVLDGRVFRSASVLATGTC